MSGYGRRDQSGLDMAMAGMNFLSNGMRTGQAIGEQRYETDERDGVNKAYEYFAGKLGDTGDISQLDGDPMLNTRHGTMAMGKFMQQRANTETSRLGFLQKQAAADTELYENTLRPIAFAAQEAFKGGDMQRFAGIASELSAKFPMPYRLLHGQDGNFDVEFRSDAAGGWTRTNQRLTPQQAMDEIDNILSGEQTILAGADMKPRTVNQRFLAASARYKMGTILGNAEALADPKKWLTLTNGGKNISAIPQNRHDDYSPAPSYRIVDEKGGMSGMVGSLDELLSQGWTLADVKADIQNKQRIAAGRGAGGTGGVGGAGVGSGSVGGMPYKLSDAQNKFIFSQATSKDEFGNETTDPSKGMILEMLMGMFGQSQYAALRAYQEGVLPVVAQLHREDPSIPLAQAQQVASGRYYSWLMQKSKGGQSASKTTPAAQETKPNGNLKVHKKIKDAAAGSNQGAPAGNE